MLLPGPELSPGEERGGAERAWSCPDPGAENGEQPQTGAESCRLA